MREEGAGSVLAVGIVAVVVAAAGLVMPLAVVLDARQRAAAAADASALAASDTALGWSPGQPCAAADRVAAATGVQVTRCVVRETTVRVETAAEALGFPIAAAAVAGPRRDSEGSARAPGVGALKYGVRESAPADHG
jgi:secretion/DNA translocation related TadE-like protein